MSEGERSCVLAMLEAPSAAQVTTKASPNDQFYWAAESLGWARRAEIDENLAAVGLLARWALTDEGRQSFPRLLALVEIHKRRQAYDTRLPMNLFCLALKFTCGYVLVYSVFALGAFGLTRFGLNLRPIQGFLSIVLLFVSFLFALFAALTPWSLRRSEIDKANLMGASESIRANRWLLCIYLAPLIFGFHVVLEKIIVRFDPIQAAQLAGNSAMRSAVMAAIVCGGCWWILPSALHENIARILKR